VELLRKDPLLIGDGSVALCAKFLISSHAVVPEEPEITPGETTINDNLLGFAMVIRGNKGSCIVGTCSSSSIVM
jgi:hypothetical protein